MINQFCIWNVILHNSYVIAIYDNIKGVRSELLFTTHLSGLFQINVFVWYSILFFYGHRDKQNRVPNKNFTYEESTWMNSNKSGRALAF